MKESDALPAVAFGPIHSVACIPVYPGQLGPGCLVSLIGDRAMLYESAGSHQRKDVSD